MTRITTSKAEISLIRDCFIRINISEGALLEVEDVRAIHDAKWKLLKPNQKHVVMVVSGKFASITREAREFSATDMITTNRVATAMVVHSLAQKLIGNFFIRNDKPKGKARVFNCPDQAARWLSKFCQP